MTFKHPNLKDTPGKNVSHVGYIATRSGVDKSLTESDLKKELEKGVEDLSSDDDTYVKYIDERPRSHGLFGQDGIEDPEDVQNEVSNVSSYVWRAIVSLKEDDAKNLGYLEKDKWQDMLRKKVPDMANEMGIKTTNLRWVAAIHMEKGHPHAHLMFWEKEPERTLGIVNTKSLDNIRKMYTDEIFEEERFQLLNEKNAMRDLLNDLAKGDIGQAARLLKEVRAAGQDLKTFIDGLSNEGVTPRLYSEEEQKIAGMLKELADKLPGKGRVALKFMPDDTKEEVRAIADFLLQQPEFSASLEKNLKAVEELTRMYTGKEGDIQKARDNAYKDMRDRICQVILKGAVESQRDNLLYVDQELSQKAVDYIKGMNNAVDLEPEHTRLMNEITVALVRTGHTDEQIKTRLTDFSDREHFGHEKEAIDQLIKQVRTGGAGIRDINVLSPEKKVEYYLSVLKLAGYNEDDAFKLVREAIKRDSEELDKKLQQLKEDGYLKGSSGDYKLTNKGIEEFLNVKELDGAEKAIFKMLEADGENIPKAGFKELLDNKEVFGNLYDKDPEEFKIGKFDTKIRDEFGEENRITLKQLEANIYERYTDDEQNTNIELAEKEYDILKHRIEKLTLNGYVELDKETGVYSFTDESLEYFEYNEKKEGYILTKEAIDKFNIPEQMEFTRYDAGVTLSYIDKAENGILTHDQLHTALKNEIVNKTAIEHFNRFSELLSSDQMELVKKYISIDESGNMQSTEDGKWLGINLNKLNKYFQQSKGSLTDEKLKAALVKEIGQDKADQEFQKISSQLQKQIEKGHITKDQETGIYKVDKTILNINRLLYQIYKEGGALKKADLKAALERNVPNQEAEKQFKYLVKRLDNLKHEGYLDGKANEYSLNAAGIEKRADLLIPERDLLRHKLKYLERLGFISKTEEGYQATDNYYQYMKKVAASKEAKTERESKYITKDIAAIIDRTQDQVDVGKIRRNNERIATGKLINNEYEGIKTEYEAVRSICGVPDTLNKTVTNLSTTLMVSGVSLEGTKEILQQWNLSSNTNIPLDKLNEIIEKAHSVVKDNNLLGKTTVISTQDWKAMFESLGVPEKDTPKWIYKGENWKSPNIMFSIINDIWKSAWQQLERQRMQTEAQADMLKKSINQQQAANQNKEAIIEQMRKNKDRSSIEIEDDREM